MKAKRPSRKREREREQRQATKATMQLRIHDVLRIRLDGAEPWDVRHYVSEKEAAGEAPWTILEGGKPLGERQIRRYVVAADQLIAESCRTSRKRLLRNHLAQRRNLYARSVQTGDMRTALAVLVDLATMQDLYPAKRLKLGATGGSAVKILIAEDGFNPDDA